jgi:hypothetical protein
MIVTGELVKDLGTSKFVPIVRQENGGKSLPRSVSTRYYADLSDGRDVGEQFKDLLHKIHKVPRARKPVLGKSPFVAAGTGDASGSPAVGAPVIPTALNDASATYNKALDLARQGDMVEWRRLVRAVKQPLPAALAQWRGNYGQGHGFLKEALPKVVAEAAGIYSPLMCVALAGVQSGNADFINQQSLIDDFLSPSGWELSGTTILTRIPEAMVFTYQALHGAACLDSRQLPAAIALSRARIHRPQETASTVLFQDTALIGWPESFETHCTRAWSYLLELPTHWAWIPTVFGSVDDYMIALSAYYMALNVQELADRIVQGEGTLIEGEEVLRLTVPILFCSFPREILVRAYRLLLERPDEIRAIWRSMGVKDPQMAEAWPKWIQQCRRWLGRLYPYGLTHGPIIQTDLFSDIRPEA